MSNQIVVTNNGQTIDQVPQLDGNGQPVLDDNGDPVYIDDPNPPPDPQTPVIIEAINDDGSRTRIGVLPWGSQMKPVCLGLAIGDAQQIVLRLPNPGEV